LGGGNDGWIMTVHTQPDYHIQATAPAPTGYPARPAPDCFSEEPFLPDYQSRRQAFCEHILNNPAPHNTKPAWHELARLAAGGTPHAGVFHAALDFIDARKDCADFVLHGILRYLYMMRNEGKEERNALTQRARQSVLGFKYFPDEPGIDSMCTWTENHYILFTSAAYLAGQLYPDEVFPNTGETGQQKMERNRPRILRWLDLRFRTGFSEWLSHVYYDEDLTALLSLYDFASEEEIRLQSETVINLLLLDMALNSFKGVFGSTHGRAYENTKKWADNEGTTDTSKLLFGSGIFSGFDNMSAIAFALSGYRLPKAIEAIAQEATCSENRQRMGIRLSATEQWGIPPIGFENGMHCLTLEAYAHPLTIANTLRMFDTCNWWENRFLSAFKPYRRLLKAVGALGGLPVLARYLERDLCRNTREEVNIYTYKTPDYMLSTAQDYRKGYGGDQQHIWQATLGRDAVCFTTHPAKLEGVTPNYWAGSGLLPRAAQYKNITIVIYNLEKIPALYVPIRHFYTHAWLPKDRFDEVVENEGWIFARRGEGYLALRSQRPYFWNTQSGVTHQEETAHTGIQLRRAPEDFEREVVAPGAQNIWICQMGRKAEDGTFEQFVHSISSAEILFSGLNITFHSPGRGLLRFGWEGPLEVNGVEIPLQDYPRYDNPYVQAEFDPAEINVAVNEDRLTLRSDCPPVHG
jgi:hypothetical protein